MSFKLIHCIVEGEKCAALLTCSRALVVYVTRMAGNVPSFMAFLKASDEHETEHGKHDTIPTCRTRCKGYSVHCHDKQKKKIDTEHFILSSKSEYLVLFRKKLDKEKIPLTKFPQTVMKKMKNEINEWRCFTMKLNI